MTTCMEYRAATPWVGGHTDYLQLAVGCRSSSLSHRRSQALAVAGTGDGPLS